MDWLQMIGFCLLTAVMVMLLRQMTPAAAGLVSAAGGALLLLAVLPSAAQYVQMVREFMQSLSMDDMYARVMFKAMGIVLLTQLASAICRDLDAPSVAQHAQLCGRLALLGVAVPVFISLTQMAVGVLRGGV